MITLEKLLSYEKTELESVAQGLLEDDIRQLVEWLGEKDDNTRYYSFLLLQYRSVIKNDVYQYWDVFIDKFKSPNSYQRSLGIMLTAANAKWDNEGRFDETIDAYLSFCDDEKPVTVRQCIQSLANIVPYKKHLCGRIIDRLISINLNERKDTQRKLLLTDILGVLACIRKVSHDEKIDIYISNAMMGGLLDKKAKAEIAALLA